MERYIQEEDILIMYVTAASFPEGIQEAFDTVKSTTSGIGPRTLFGISKPEKGVIIYKAGIRATDVEEARKLHLETFVLEKGEYLTENISDWENNISKVGKVFGQLLCSPLLAPSTYCIEWYREDGLMCMVKLLK